MCVKRAGTVSIVAMMCASFASRAYAYDEDVHSFLVRAALGEVAGLANSAPEVSAGAMAAVRSAIDAWARNSSEESIRAEWTRRYPSPEKFDDWAFKELLLLSPNA